MERVDIVSFGFEAISPYISSIRTSDSESVFAVEKETFG
jgi:hypothetical protein